MFEWIKLDLVIVELWLLFAGFFILFLDMFFSLPKKVFNYVSFFSLLVAVGWVAFHFSFEAQGFHQFIFADHSSHFLKILLIISTAICVFISPQLFAPNKIDVAEFHFLIHTVLVSMLFMISSTHLFFIYICLETASITSFILCSLTKDKFSIEGGIKYFLLNAFSSAILLYGIALLFGLSNSFDLYQIKNLLAQQENQLLLTLGIFFLIVGFAFKISLIPFHMWAPDVYAGSILTVVAFFSIPLKIAFVAVFFKISSIALFDFPLWEWMLGIMVALTFVLGNLLALVQNNIKRLLAYSSISHAGFFVLGILNASKSGVSSLYFYLVVYTFASLGVFSCLVYLSQKKEIVFLKDLKGLGLQHPYVASCFLFFLFSLAGLPITGGFIGKLFLFYYAIQSEYFFLVIAGLLASVISVGYYFKFGVSLFSSPNPFLEKSICPRSAMMIILCFIVVLILGIFPSLLNWNSLFI